MVAAYGKQKGAYVRTNGGPESDKDSTPLQAHLLYPVLLILYTYQNLDQVC
jgi:hypothetical protein